MRKDGNAAIYKIQHRQKNGEWVISNLDYFGYPEGFTACGRCWQETGHTGTYSKREAIKGLAVIRKRHQAYTFRLVLQTITQHTEVLTY